MNLLEACSHGIVTAKGSTTIVEAAQLMRKHHVGALVVLGEEVPVRPVGIVTDRDIVLKVVARAVDLKSVTVDQVMSRNVVFAPGSCETHDAIERMRKNGVRRMLVTGEGGDLRGIVSFDDMLALVAEELGGMAQLIATGMVHEERRLG